MRVRPPLPRELISGSFRNVVTVCGDTISVRDSVSSGCDKGSYFNKAFPIICVDPIDRESSFSYSSRSRASSPAYLSNRGRCFTPNPKVYYQDYTFSYDNGTIVIFHD